MSKHQKEVRRAQRKAERARRSRVATHGAAALAAAAAIAAGTSAYAEPIRFDNPAGAGHFDWVPSSAGEQNLWLDVDAPADAQPAFNAASSFRQIWGGGQPDKGKLQGGGGDSDLQIGGPYNSFVLGVDGGDLIPSGLLWGAEGYVYYPGVGSQLPEGAQRYLGVRFDLGAFGAPEVHYGWIGVVRNGAFLDAFAWGYETTPGAPIAAGVPEPGTLALLAMGALVGVRRRRA